MSCHSLELSLCARIRKATLSISSQKRDGWRDHWFPMRFSQPHMTVDYGFLQLLQLYYVESTRLAWLNRIWEPYGESYFRTLFALLIVSDSRAHNEYEFQSIDLVH